MSAERSPATDQAAELEELVSALGYEPDASAADHVDGPPPDGASSVESRPGSSRTDDARVEERSVDEVVETPVPEERDAEEAAIPDEAIADSPIAVDDEPLPAPAVIGAEASNGSGPHEDHAGAGVTTSPEPVDDREETPARPEPAFVPYAYDVPAPPLAPVPVPTRDPEPEPVATAVRPATSAAPRVRRRRMIRSRKVRRVIRHVDPWSVLTFSVIFHLCLFGALLLAGSLVWSAAVASGTIENVESFIRDLGDYDTWEIQGDAVLRAGVIIAGMMTLASSILVVLLTVVFNLISDLIGGIRVTVIEEEVHRVPVARRR